MYVIANLRQATVSVHILQEISNVAFLADGWGVGPRASYISMTRLMQQYKGYEFAWSIESDVRYMTRYFKI